MPGAGIFLDVDVHEEDGKDNGGVHEHLEGDEDRGHGNTENHGEYHESSDDGVQMNYDGVKDLPLDSITYSGNVSDRRG